MKPTLLFWEILMQPGLVTGELKDNHAPIHIIRATSLQASFPGLFFHSAGEA